MCNDNPGSGCIEMDEDDRYYSSIGLPGAQANTYSRPLPAEPDKNLNEQEYSTLGPSKAEQNDDNMPYYLSLKTDDTC